MGKVKVAAYSVSLDGFGAGPDQGEKEPLGIGGEALHEWIFPTKMFTRMGGKEGGTEGVDNDFAERSMENIGAWIMGRNMFGPIRGPWPNEDWKGWWGPNPPYHVPVYVLTNHSRPPLVMDGGTTFYFITEGIGKALELARVAAGEKDIRIGGGASTIRQFLLAGYIDEMHLVYAPVFLGRGESLLEGIDLLKLGFTLTQSTIGKAATHLVLQSSKK